MRYVDAQRECLRLSMRNVLLVQEVDALRKEVDNSRKVMDDAKALAVALYRGEG